MSVAAHVGRARSLLPVEPVPLGSISVEWDKFWDVILEREDTCPEIVSRLWSVGLCTKMVDGVMFEDIETARHVRDSTVRPYRFQCAQNEGAETRFLGQDCGELDNDSVQGITLPERLAIEYAHFLKKGDRLDRGGTVTLCAGSLFRGKYVPTVRYNAEIGKIEIGMVTLNVSLPNLATRRVYVTDLFL